MMSFMETKMIWHLQKDLSNSKRKKFKTKTFLSLSRGLTIQKNTSFTLLWLHPLVKKVLGWNLALPTTKPSTKKVTLTMCLNSTQKMIMFLTFIPTMWSKKMLTLPSLFLPQKNGIIPKEKFSQLTNHQTCCCWTKSQIKFVWRKVNQQKTVNYGLG